MSLLDKDFGRERTYTAAVGQCMHKNTPLLTVWT
jgi:hypothetical protein